MLYIKINSTGGVLYCHVWLLASESPSPFCWCVDKFLLLQVANGRSEVMNYCFPVGLIAAMMAIASNLLITSACWQVVASTVIPPGFTLWMRFFHYQLLYLAYDLKELTHSWPLQTWCKPFRPARICGSRSPHSLILQEQSTVDPCIQLSTILTQVFTAIYIHHKFWGNRASLARIARTWDLKEKCVAVGSVSLLIFFV